MAQRFAIDAIFRAIDQITNPVTRMARSVGRAADRMEKKLGKVNGAFDKIGAGARGVGTAVAAAGAVAGAGIALVVDKGADFEQVLIRAGAKFGGIRRGTKAFDDLGKAALDVSSVTEFGASQAGKALEFMSTAGEKSAVAMGSLGNFADFATANSAELSRAADIASDSISALGLDLDAQGKKIVDPTEKIAAYARVNDLLTTAATGANLTLDQVFETVKKGGSAALAAGQDVETFLAATQAVSGVIKGSEAGTGLRIVMRNILQTTGEAGKAMKKLRIQTADKRTGAIRDLPDILEDIKKKFDKMTEKKRAQTLTKLFGEAVPTANALLSNVDGLRERIAVMADKSKGKVKEFAGIMRDSASNSIKTFGSTIEAIEIGVFQIIRDDVVKIVDATTKWAKANKAAFGKAVMASLQFMRDNFEAIVEKGPRVLALVGSLMALAKVLGVVQAVLAVVAALTAATAGTLGLIAIAVVSVIALLGLLVVFWDDVTEAMSATSNFISDKLIATFDWLKEKFDIMVAGVKRGERGWILLATALATVLAPVLAVLAPFIALAAIGKLIFDNWEGIEGFFGKMWDGIVDTFMSSVSIIADTLTDLKEGFNDLLGIENEVKVKGAVDLPSDFGEPGLAFAGGLGVGGNFGPPGAGGPGPQVINTSDEQLQRTIEEHSKRVAVDVNLNAPPGVVKSVDRRGDDDAVQLSRSGDI